jgi:hypothetical protein
MPRPRAQAAAGQDALETKVRMLEAHQAEIHASLASMEGEAARLYQVRACVGPKPNLDPVVAAHAAQP